MRFAKNNRFLNVFYHIHLWSSILLLVAIVAIHFIFSGKIPTIDTFVVFVFGSFVLIALFRKKYGRFKKLIFIPAITILMVNYYINRNFYPELLKYQAESEVAFFMKKHSLEKEQLVSLGLREEMTSFLLERIVPMVEPELASSKNLKNKYVFTNEEGIKTIESLGLGYQLLESFPDFRITTLNGTFINKTTRDKELETKYLLKVN